MATGNRGGRPRKPTAIHVLNGNPSKISNLDERYAAEPKPQFFTPENCPPPPSYFTAEAAECWNLNAPMLARLKLLTEADLCALEAYCVNYVCFMKHARALLKGKRPLSYRPHKKTLPDSEYRDESIEARGVRAFSKEMLNWSREFGMTPAARGRMVLPDKDEAEDEMEKLLRGG
jgi:P27 family predicted phage terminase small subunit